jgi:hypothetical protein
VGHRDLIDYVKGRPFLFLFLSEIIASYFFPSSRPLNVKMTRRKKCDHHPDLVRILCADLITILLTFSHYIKIKKPRSLFALFNKAGPPMKTKLWKRRSFEPRPVIITAELRRRQEHNLFASLKINGLI